MQGLDGSIDYITASVKVPQQQGPCQGLFFIGFWGRTKEEKEKKHSTDFSCMAWNSVAWILWLANWSSLGCLPCTIWGRKKRWKNWVKNLNFWDRKERKEMKHFRWLCHCILWPISHCWTNAKNSKLNSRFQKLSLISNHLSSLHPTPRRPKSADNKAGLSCTNFMVDARRHCRWHLHMWGRVMGSWVGLRSFLK